MKCRLPITVFYDGAYHQPGTELDLPDDEAQRLIALHGEIDSNWILSNEDISSLETLNKFSSLYGGHGS